MAHLLVVEDEPAMQQGLRDNLTFEGYTVDTASDGQAGLDMITSGTYDLVLLDVMLPNLSGFDVCRMARQAGCTMPILMLTAKGEELDTVLGLELGADDYITKPFSLRELLARIKAALRRRPVSSASLPSGGPVQIGRLTVDFDACEAQEGTTHVPMTHLELEVLRYLVDHHRHPVSRDDLLADVWGYESSPTTRTIDNFILKLRQKIEEDPSSPRHILTAHGIGYKLIMTHEG